MAEDRLPALLKVASDFLSSLTMDHEFFLASFNAKPQLKADFSSDRLAIKNALSALSLNKVSGNTALYEAVYHGLQKLKASKHQKKALIVFTDGGDNLMSDYGVLKKRFREWCVPIYFVGTRSGEPMTRNRQADAIIGDVIETCGGAVNLVVKSETLGGKIGQLAKAVEQQYVVGLDFASGTDNKSGWHRVEITVTSAAAIAGKPVVNGARGHYFPKQSSN